MKILQKYFAREIGRSVLFVLIAFLALFAFFDLVAELKSVGQGGYTLQQALIYVALGLPGYVYELMPIAALIGSIWALSQFAARSEFTIMRASSMSTSMAGGMLVKIGLVFALITFVFAEFVVPYTSVMAERTKMLNKGRTLSTEFRSGLWTKDTIRTEGITGDAIGTRFLNIRKVNADGKLDELKIYEFNSNFYLTALITAKRADYQGNNHWTLYEGSEARFGEGSLRDASS